jgi:hypothetical protein
MRGIFDWLRRDFRAALSVAFLLALLGALAFVLGATLELWPVWSAGVVAVVASVLAYRP